MSEEIKDQAPEAGAQVPEPWAKLSTSSTPS